MLAITGTTASVTANEAASREAGWVAPTVTEQFPGVWRVRFGTPEKFTPNSIREAAPRGEQLKTVAPPGPLPFELHNIRGHITASRTTVYVPFEGGSQQIYGFGLDPGAYQQLGLTKNLSVCASVLGKTGASHGPVPFYLSTSGYGVYVDTARVPIVEVARLEPNRSSGTAATGAALPKTSEAELYAAPAANGREVVLDLPGNSSGVDVFVFAGPAMRIAVQRYNLFSGGGAVPPWWGLGLKYRTYTRADQTTVLKAARALRALRIPCDMIGLEPGWQSQSYSCSYTWSPERFPEPQVMIQELQSLGFKINLWEHAYVHPTSPLFTELKSRSGDQLVWHGLVVDFADPKAFELFAGYHGRELVDLGILGFKADECDKQPPTDATPFNFPYCTIFPSGIDGDQMTQLYGAYYQRALLAPFKARNLRTWGDVRAATALAAPLPFNLYSDAYSFDEYLRQLVNASFAGLLWSPEVRKAESREELLNRVALSAFAPQMCLDLWFMPNPVWEQFDQAKNEHHELLPEAEQQILAGQLRAIIERRYEFLPYLYAAFMKYHETGLPPVRSLLLDFPEDQRLGKVDDAFMFGDAILVAPFCGTASSRQVILPQGVRWFEWKTRRWHDGGTISTVTGTPGDIPLFVKENSLLPLAEPVQQVEPTTVFKITVNAIGDHPEPCHLYEDDGTSHDFETGAANRLQLTWSAADGGKVRRTGNFPRPRYEILRWTAAAEITGKDPGERAGPRP